VETSGQGAAVRIALLIRALGFENARRAGADENAHARRTISPYGRHDRFGKAVLGETDLREAVVTAFVVAQVGTHRMIVDALDLADPRIEARTLEAAGYEATALPAQRSERGIKTAAGATGGSKVREQERFHYSPVLLWVQVGDHRSTDGRHRCFNVSK
jgi:hypothetical protein